MTKVPIITALRQGNLFQLNYLWAHFRNYPRDIATIVMATIVSICTILAIGQVLKYIIDNQFSSASNQFMDPLYILIIVTLAIAVSAFFRISCTLNLSEKICQDIRLDRLQTLLKCPYTVFENQSVGDLQNRLSTDITVIKTFLAGPAAVGLRNIIQLVGSIILLFLASPLLSICIVLMLPLILIPLKILGQKSRAASLAVQNYEGHLNGLLGEILSGILVIKSFNAEANFIARIQLHLNNKLQLNRHQAFYRSLIVAIVILLIFTAVISVLWVGIYQVAHHNLSAGNLTSFIFYAVLLINGTNNLTDILSQAHGVSGAIDRITVIDNYEKELTTFTTPAPFPIKDSMRISLKDVSFGYPQHPDTTVLNSISMNIDDGDKVAIVGASGSGKSTLLKLLMGLYRPQSGSIVINGIKTCDHNLLLQRALFSYVPQDIMLFDGTVLDNITLFNTFYNLPDIMHAARLSLVDDFAKMLPQGYNTPLGAHGLKLSGGQRQRIALARALLHDAPIILLDEATNALDNISETIIQKTLLDPGYKKTVLIIAHRLSTIQHVDRIFVMHNKGIVAQGRHDELMLTCPHYHKLYTTELQQA